jgi:hypothetical protein
MSRVTFWQRFKMGGYIVHMTHKHGPTMQA